MTPRIAVVALWAFWVISWVAAMSWSNRTEKRADRSTELRYRIPLAIGALLMFVPLRLTLVRARGFEDGLRLWQTGWIGAWICVLGVAVGFAFAWWARIHLGRLWSANITRKTDHRLVNT